VKIHHFSKKSRIQVPVEKAFEWHEKAGAIERLTPPWEKIQIISRSGGIKNGDQTFFKVKVGPFWMKWLAHHIEYEKNAMFTDIQRDGPFLFWEHNHRFHADGDHAHVLEDSLRFRLPLSPFSDIVALTSVKKRLNRMFEYRHAITKNDLTHMLNYGASHNIVITGASGVLGTALVPFLRTQGHFVKRMVRKSPQQPDEAHWNPYYQEIDKQAFDNVDTVIHLAGEYIGEGRWTPEKKKRIIGSRVKGTHFLAHTLCNLKTPPKTLICASAIGYYGNRGDEILTESSSKGADFISDVCEQWEQAAQPAIDAGIRVVFLRIGIVLSPRGGALERLLPVFRSGVGLTFGAGDQVLSWISEDDFLGAVNHVIHHPKLSGPVNLTAPNPVSQKEFSKTLADTFKHPLLIRIPDWIIKPIYGQMGNEVILSGNYAMPDQLISTNYSFVHPKLENAFQHLLGIFPFDNNAASQFNTIRN
jgi:hypothetical protein